MPQSLMQAVSVMGQVALQSPSLVPGRSWCQEEPGGSSLSPLPAGGSWCHQGHADQDNNTSAFGEQA